MRRGDESSKSVYSDATDPYYLPTEREMFKVLNKISGTCTIWDFTLKQFWFNQEDKDEEYMVYCPFGRSHKEWLEQEGLVEFMKKDINKIQLFRIIYFYCGEDLFNHISKANGYASLIHLRLMHYL